MHIGDVSPIVSDLQNQMLQKGYTKDEVRAAIDKIYKEWHLRTVDYVKGTLPSDLGIDVIARDLIDEKLVTAIDTIRATYVGAKPHYFKRLRKKAHIDSCYKDLLLYIVNHRERSPSFLHLQDGTQTQHFCRGITNNIPQEKAVLSKKSHFTEGTALSSENDKGQKHFEILAHNTNLASLAHHSVDGKKEDVLLIRSGKSDSLERHYETVLFACLEQLEAENPKGLVEVTPGHFTFQHHITTHLDPSSLKSLSMRMVGSQEDEQRYIAELIHARDLWPDEGYKISVIKDGKQVEVVLKKPLITNQIFSQLVRGVKIKTKKIASLGQGRAERVSFQANMQFLDRYLTKQKDSLASFKKMLKTSERPLEELLNDKEFFKSKEYKAFQHELAEHLYKKVQASPGQAIEERALFALFFHQNVPNDLTAFTPNPKAKQAMHTADVAIFRNLLLDTYNLSQGVQCKSGTDRTGLAAALVSAQAAFTRDAKKPFVPGLMNEKETLLFKKYFREAVKLFAVSVTVETRGFPGLKWGGGVSFFGGKGNPIPYKYLYLEEDLEKLKAYGIDDKTKPDVIGLQYKDLQNGISQYKGKIRDARQLFGFTDKKVAKETKALQKSIPHATIKAATEEATAYLKKELGIKAKQLFDKDMHLAVQIKSLHLEEHGREKALQAKVYALKTKANRTQKESLFLYMLDQVLHSWTRVHNESIDK